MIGTDAVLLCYEKTRVFGVIEHVKKEELNVLISRKNSAADVRAFLNGNLSSLKLFFVNSLLPAKRCFDSLSWYHKADMRYAFCLV